MKNLFIILFLLISTTVFTQWTPPGGGSGGGGGASTNLTYSGTTSPVDLNSSTGTDVTFTAGTGMEFNATTSDLIISQTPRYFDIIATGQSNMVNRDITQGSWVFDTLPQVQVYDIATGIFQTANPYANNISPEDEPGANVRNNIAFAYAKNYIADHPYDSVRMTVSADGGENSDKWLSGGFMRDSIVAKLDRIAVIAPDFNAQVILVHQGERNVTDADVNDWLNDWINFYDFITARSDVSDSCIMLFGSFAQTTTTYESIQQAVDSIYYRLRYVGGRRMYAVEYRTDNTSEIYPDGNNVHFTNEKIDAIGYYYYQAFKAGQPVVPANRVWAKKFNMLGVTHSLGAINMATSTAVIGGLAWSDYVFYRLGSGSGRIANAGAPSRALQIDVSSTGASLYGLGSASNSLSLWAYSTAGTTTGNYIRLALDGNSSAANFTKLPNNANDVLTVNCIAPNQTGDLISLQENSTERFVVTHDGRISQETTVTAGGTTGNQTIDKPTGTVNFAAAATSLTVTNASCTANSYVEVGLMTNDATADLGAVVVSAGSFVIHMKAAPTAETKVWFRVNN